MPDVEMYRSVYNGTQMYVTQMYKCQEYRNENCWNEQK